jgi:hypothetical protein
MDMHNIFGRMDLRVPALQQVCVEFLAAGVHHGRFADRLKYLPPNMRQALVDSLPRFVPACCCPRQKAEAQGHQASSLKLQSIALFPTLTVESGSSITMDLLLC